MQHQHGCAFSNKEKLAWTIQRHYIMIKINIRKNEMQCCSTVKEVIESIPVPVQLSIGPVKMENISLIITTILHWSKTNVKCCSLNGYTNVFLRQKYMYNNTRKPKKTDFIIKT